jgi:sugar phosphate permease
VLCVIFIWSFFSSKESPDSVFPGVIYGKNKSQKKSISEFENSSDDQNETNESVMNIMTGLLRLKLFRQLLVYSFVTTLLRSIFFFWIPKLLVDIGMSDSGAIMKSAVFPFLGCVGTVLLGWYTDKFAGNGDRARAMWIMLTGLAVSLFSIAFLINTPDSHNLIVTLLGMSGFFLLGPYAMSSGCLTLDIAGSKGAGSCTGLIDGIGYLGGGACFMGCWCFV